MTGEAVAVIYADAASAGAETAAAAHEHGIRLIVVMRPEESKGRVLLPKRWVVERRFAWVSRFRRLRLSLALQTVQLDRRFIMPSEGVA